MMKSAPSLKKHKLLSGLYLLFLFSAASFCFSSPAPGDSLHFDKSKLPKGCGSCHKGHGMFNTPMLPEGRDTFCFRCHGNNSSSKDARAKGYIADNISVADLQKEFYKPYRHPVDKTGVHRHNEILPETDRSAERHAECIDCHHHHYVTKENKTSDIKGVNIQGLAVQQIEFEYELCFKCHSFSANLPVDQKNKADQFKISNPSFHPVTAQGKNSDVPSLIYPLNASSLIKCTDCHNNDDPLGPQGPHSSSYRYILKKNFTSSDGAEGPYQYELCYSCHRRESILGNESFFYHDLHISVVKASCRTCHNPHGSSQYAHLIEFDNLTVNPSSKGYTEFRDLGRRAGECFLECHGKDHNPMTYPVATTLKESSSSSSRRSLRR
jgi:predicted CXXCH cytochrome family protein